MPLFRKRSNQAPAVASASSLAANETDVVNATHSNASLRSSSIPASEVGTSGTGSGPVDLAEESELGTRIDLGSLRVPVVPGMQVRMELDRSTQQITGVTVMLNQEGVVSSLQLQVFAAPKKLGIWDEIREEISAGITKAGGTADDVPGEFGRELIARIPGPGPSGTQVKTARFVGLDGPRWFIRGVFTGPAATDPKAAAALEGIWRQIVVVRGDSPLPPRDLLPLTLPGQAKKIEDPSEAKVNFDPLTRGPEITEIH
jgi:hypothetical protein